MRASWEKSPSCGFQPKRQLSRSGRSEAHSRRRSSQECVQEWAAALRSCWKRPGLTLSPEKGPALHGLSEDHRGCPKTSGWLAGRKQKAPSEATLPFPGGPLRATGGALAPGPPPATAAQPRWFLPDSAPPFRHPSLWCALWWKRVREAESGPPHQFWNLPPPGRSRKAVVFSLRGRLLRCPSCLPPRWQPLSTSPCPRRLCTCPLAVLPQKAVRPRPGEREGGHGAHSLADRVSDRRGWESSPSVPWELRVPRPLPSRRRSREHGEHAVSCLQVPTRSLPPPDQALRLGANYKPLCALFLLLHNGDAHNTYNRGPLCVKYSGLCGMLVHTKNILVFLVVIHNPREKERMLPDFTFSHLKLWSWG